MPEKKKISAAKSNDSRMSKPPAPKPIKAAEPPLHPAGPADNGAAAMAAPLNAPNQLNNFEAAMKLFHARNLREARELFQQAAEGPERDVANRSRMHIAMCDQRLRQPTVSLQTAEDYYNYGVALLNTRNVAEARGHLEKALQMSPASDHIHYALAAALALDGDTPGAYENLKRAIELEPRNRLMARQDADLAHLADQSPFDALLYPEKKNW